jgi:hypothetical protein
MSTWSIGYVLNFKDQGMIMLDQMPQDKWFTMLMKLFPNVINQEIRVWRLHPPQIADEPGYPLGASKKLWIQVTCILVLNHAYENEMNVQDDMKMFRISYLDDHCEG